MQQDLPLHNREVCLFVPEASPLWKFRALGHIAKRNLSCSTRLQVGEALHARVVVSKRSRQFVAFQTLCESVQRGVVVVEGEAMAKIRPAA